MKKTIKVAMLAAVMVTGCALFAGPHGGHRHHHHKRDGLDLAAGIVNLVMSVAAPVQVVAAPAPVVVAPPPVHCPRPVIMTPPPRYHYRQNYRRHHRPVPHYRPAPDHGRRPFRHR